MDRLMVRCPFDVPEKLHEEDEETKVFHLQLRLWAKEMAMCDRVVYRNCG